MIAIQFTPFPLASIFTNLIKYHLYYVQDLFMPNVTQIDSKCGKYG